MKKYLFALSAFLLVPTGALAQTEEQPKTQSLDHHKNVIVYKAGLWNGEWKTYSNSHSMKELEEFAVYLRDQYNIYCPPLQDELEEDTEQEEAPEVDEPTEGNEEEAPEVDEPTEGNEEETPEVDEPEENEGSDQDQSVDQHAFVQEVIDLTNDERTSRGLSPLEADTQLNEVATVKSEDMRDNNYFSHDSPTYGSPFDMMNHYGVEYRGAGENIAAGQRSPEEVVNGWMNSQGHRENILNADYTHIGVGYAEGGSYGSYWTQMFNTK